MNGIINLYKPKGISSNQALGRVKKRFQEKKAGHIGTLDPLASGVLPIFLGKYTKLIPLFNTTRKVYRVQFALGLDSDTHDTEGQMREVPIPAGLEAEEIKAKLLEFVGTIDQVPPHYSALKKNGVPLYRLARQGIFTTPEARRMTIHCIDGISIQGQRGTFRVECSSGTYVRALVRDLGQKLGTAAVMTDLERQRCGDIFSVETAVNLDRLSSDLQSLEMSFTMPVQRALSGISQCCIGDDRRMKRLAFGQNITIRAEELVLKADAGYTATEGCEKPNMASSADQRFHAVFNEQGDLLALGFLEFSRDSPSPVSMPQTGMVRFIPQKVLI